MLEREMVDLFAGTLQGQYYTSCSMSGYFTDMVMFGERIELGIKLGKIQDISVDRGQTSGAKKAFGGNKKKEGESSALYSKRGKGRYQQYDHQVAAVTIPSAAAPQGQAYVPRQGNRLQTPPRKFDALPMSYADILSYLLKLKMVELRTWKVDPNKLPKYFDANARCDFHSDGQGHTVENCIAFKHKV